jgi:hypothetical protein
LGGREKNGNRNNRRHRENRYRPFGVSSSYFYFLKKLEGAAVHNPKLNNGGQRVKVVHLENGKEIIPQSEYALQQQHYRLLFRHFLLVVKIF